MTFGEQIRQWREERRLGLRRFAKAVGVSPAFVSQMERGLGSLPGEANILKMARLFGKDPDEVLALADKVAREVTAIIIKEPALARFLREHQHLTRDQWLTLATNLATAMKNKAVASCDREAGNEV